MEKAYLKAVTLAEHRKKRVDSAWLHPAATLGGKIKSLLPSLQPSLSSSLPPVIPPGPRFDAIAVLDSPSPAGLTTAWRLEPCSINLLPQLNNFETEEDAKRFEEGGGDGSNKSVTGGCRAVLRAQTDTDRQAASQADRQTDGHKYRHAGRQADRPIGRQTGNRQMDGPVDRLISTGGPGAHDPLCVARRGILFPKGACRDEAQQKCCNTTY